MKIIDEKGRIFGRLNIIDVFFLLQQQLGIFPAGRNYDVCMECWMKSLGVPSSQR